MLSTCVEDPKLHVSDALLAKVLEQRGHLVETVSWNGPERFDYSHVDAVVLRANWDYHEEPQAFLAWLDCLDERGVRVLNDTALVRWNFDKRYLVELQAKLRAGSSDTEVDGEGGTAGGRLRVPEVHVVDQHDPEGIVALMVRLGWEEAVLKSLSGQSGYHCERICRDSPEAWEAAARAIPTEAALLQAYQPEISTLGETVFVFFSGEFSHAVRRVVAAGEWRANSRFGAVKEAVVSPSPLLVEQARRVLQFAPTSAPPLYARVDGIAHGDTLTLMELELIEPALYMETDAGAADRFADALEKAVLTGDAAPRWERRLRPRAAAASALGGPRPREPAIGGDLSPLSAQVRCACFARAAPPARLQAPLVTPALALDESSRRCRRRAPRPTPAGFSYWGRSKAPFCLSKVCSPRPRRASSASQSTSGRPPRWERRLRPRAAAAGALGGPRPRAPAIGGDTRYLSARARCAICARAAPPARLEALMWSVRE